ncbi:MAG: carboxymuconolactone decarboxylase family protein [Candidatus Hydrogenedentes bacterium]|nr:carboxymuconolactone decarboxylase family protein [Candidatus Hydrogenedentota bacterium]
MPRMEYYAIAGEPFGHLLQINAYLGSGDFDQKLRALVEIRVSQINGCVFCVDKHSKEARALGESQQRLDSVAVWHESPFFTARERAAFEYAESVTHVSQSHVPDEVFDALRDHFSEKEIVDLTVCVSTMNAWNRIAVAFRKMPDAD